jgi:carbonic anhydrase
MEPISERLIRQNEAYRKNGNAALRRETARNGQHPYAIVICCSDSRVIPEQIFSADIGELFVVRVAGNVLDRHALGSIEYAAAHLGTECIVLLGHTGCGAVAAALSGHAEGYIADLTAEIQAAIGDTLDPLLAAKRNVLHGTERIRRAFSDHPEIRNVEIIGAVYDIETGAVEWL